MPMLAYGHRERWSGLRHGGLTKVRVPESISKVVSGTEPSTRDARGQKPESTFMSIELDSS